MFSSIPSSRRRAKRLPAILSLAASLCIANAASAQTPASPDPIEVRVVVVTAFEIGEDTGDAPGEFQAWAEQMPQTLPFPQGFRNLRYDPASKTLAIMTSMGTNRAATSVLALGLDPRFDLRRAYWVVAAIAGVNPNEASLGSAAWIGHLVDSDFAYVVDARELPQSYATGFMPFGRNRPYAQPVSQENRSYNLYTLNTKLRDWAFERTKNVALQDSPALKAERAKHASYAKAQLPPFVLKGDEVTGQGFWHGKLLNEHAERWTRYWVGDQGRFVMTGMEDTGVVNALQRLEAVGRADVDRLLVLRTASNYSVPPDGESPVAHEMETEFGPGKVAFDSARRVAGPIVRELSGQWDKYRDSIPE